MFNQERMYEDTRLYERVPTGYNSIPLIHNNANSLFTPRSGNTSLLIDIEVAVKERANNPFFDRIPPMELYQDIVNDFVGVNAALPDEHRDRLLRMIDYFRFSRHRESALASSPMTSGVNYSRAWLNSENRSEPLAVSSTASIKNEIFPLPANKYEGMLQIDIQTNGQQIDGNDFGIL